MENVEKLIALAKRRGNKNLFAFIIGEAWISVLYVSDRRLLLGAIPTGYLVTKWYRGTDIRKVGTGKVGAANVLNAVPGGWLNRCCFRYR